LALSPAFRGPEGNLLGSISLPLALGGGLAIAAALGRRLALPAAWLVLVLLGQAVSLQLIRAGPLIGYQHYLPPAQLFAAAHLPALLFLGFETVAVGLGLWRIRAGLRQWLTPRLGPVQLVVVAGFFFATSATLSKSVAVYGAELVLATAIQLVHLGAVVLVAASIPPFSLRRLHARLEKVLGAPAGEPQPGGIDAFALACAAVVTIAAAVLAVVAYQMHPHVPDEVVYLIPARYFAHGRLWLAPPPVPAGFDLDLMTFEATRWYSPVPPAWPAILAIGAFFHAEWFVNAVLGGIDVLLAYMLVRELYDRRTARASIALLALSPWFVFLAMSAMTHTSAFLFALLGALGAARLRRQVGAGRSLAAAGWALLGGIGLGALSMTRPLEGLTAAIVIGSCALFGAGWLRRLPYLAGMALATLATAALTLPYNKALSGNPLVFPLMAYTDAHYGKGTNALGFGPNRGLGWPGLDPRPGHDLIDVFINANFNSFQINIELLGWAAGSILLLVFALASWRRLRPADWSMAAMIGAIVFAHSFYWFSGGPDFGARYWYLVLLPCLVLSVRGVQLLAHAGDVARAGSPAAAASPAAQATSGVARHRRSAETALAAAVMALCLGAALVFFPWRAADKYYHYRTQRPDVRRLAAQYNFGRSLVLVRGTRWEYEAAAIYNPLDLRADAPIYAWDRSPQVRAQLLRAYADRPVWTLDAPSLTGRAFRVASGPTPAAALIAGPPASAPGNAPAAAPAPAAPR
ncbi:MAG TPA: hypothetical protein VF832_20025, partial [Longimicrobiales bacterium]